MPHQCELLQDSISHLPKLLPNASWYQKLKHKLWKLTLVSPSHPEIFKYLKSSKAMEKESKRQVHLRSFVIHPLSEFRKYWNLIIFLMLFLHQALTAFSIGFFVELELDAIQGLILIDVIICSILFLEIFISFRTGVIVQETNQIILNPLKLLKVNRRNIIKDIINALPYIYLMTFIVDAEHTTVNINVIIFMVLLTLYNNFYFNRMLFYCSSLSTMLNLTEKWTRISKIVLRSIVLIHWATCLRRLVPLLIDQQNQNDEVIEFMDLHEPTKFFVISNEVDHVPSGPEDADDLIEELDEIFKNYTMFHKYTRSMLITLRTGLQAGVGYETTDSILMMLMSMFLMIGGWIYSSFVMVYIFNIIVASETSENKFEEMLREFEAFCDSKYLSDNIRQRVKMFLERKFEKNYFNEEAIRHSTPACLQKEIMMNKCSNLLARVDLFKEIPPLLVEKIISCLQFELYFQDDVIIQANTTGDSMYFIAYGTAAIISPSGHRLQTIIDGSHFGEIALLMKGQKRTATVKALEVCEVYKLSQRDFRKVIEPHGELVQRMELIAQRRIQKNQLRFSLSN